MVVTYRLEGTGAVTGPWTSGTTTTPSLRWDRKDASKPPARRSRDAVAIVVPVWIIAVRVMRGVSVNVVAQGYGAVVFDAGGIEAAKGGEAVSQFAMPKSDLGLMLHDCPPCLDRLGRCPVTGPQSSPVHQQPAVIWIGADCPFRDVKHPLALLGGKLVTQSLFADEELGKKRQGAGIIRIVGEGQLDRSESSSAIASTGKGVRQAAVKRRLAPRHGFDDGVKDLLVAAQVLGVDDELCRLLSELVSSGQKRPRQSEGACRTRRFVGEDRSERGDGGLFIARPSQTFGGRFP